MGRQPASSHHIYYLYSPFAHVAHLLPTTPQLSANRHVGAYAFATPARLRAGGRSSIQANIARHQHIALTFFCLFSRSTTTMRRRRGIYSDINSSVQELHSSRTRLQARLRTYAVVMAPHSPRKTAVSGRIRARWYFLTYTPCTFRLPAWAPPPPHNGATAGPTLLSVMRYRPRGAHRLWNMGPV